MDTDQPQSSAMPAMPSAPVPPVEPVVPVNAMPAMPSAPVPPVEPVVPVNAMPEMRGGASAEPVSEEIISEVATDETVLEDVSVPEAPAVAPVAPVPVVPAAPVTPEPVAAPSPAVSEPAISEPVIPAQPTEMMGEVNMTLGATDPIMMPEVAPEPDPIEQELKAPFKAASPVPGSIGSAISVPIAEQTPTDSGNEILSSSATVVPAPMPEAAPAPETTATPETTSVAAPVAEAAPMAPITSASTPAAPVPAMPKAKKDIFGNMNKKTLAILGVVASLIILALVVILIMTAI